MNALDKYAIFDHLADSYVRAAIIGDYDYENAEDTYVISHYPAPMFNFFYVSKSEDATARILNTNHPCIIIPQKNLEHDFAPIAKAANFVCIDNVVAHCFTLSDLQHHKSSQKNPEPITIKQATTDEDLIHFDAIASTCFMFEKNLAREFLTEKSLHDAFTTFFLAYDNHVPVGTIMISSVNNKAGLYWLSVLPEYRKKGIATALVFFCLHRLKAEGYDAVISQNLTPSQSLFQKIGFKPCGSLPLYMYEGKKVTHACA